MTDITLSALSGEFLHDAPIMSTDKPVCLDDDALLDGYSAYQRNRSFSEHTVLRRTCSLRRLRR